MNWSVQSILVLIALILAIVSAIRPSWPLLQVAVILICTALLATWFKP